MKRIKHLNVCGVRTQGIVRDDVTTRMFIASFPPGGLALDRSSWKRTRRPNFLLPVRVLSRVFRGKFREGLKVAFQERKLVFCGSLQHLSDVNQFQRFLNQLRRKDWVVYAKPPFGGPEHVLHYLARYTHRVAISNHRLLSFDGKEVTFRWKDYGHGNKKRKMTLSTDEFLRRFLLHVLPGGFVRIRHFGFLANRHRRSLIVLCRKLIGEEQPLPQYTTTTKLHAKTSWPCPRCSSTMLVVETLSAVQAIRYITQTASLDSS